MTADVATRLDSSTPVSYTHLDVYKRQPDRKVTHKTFWSNTLSCDNAAVPVSQLSGRLATLADLGSAQQLSLIHI